MFEFAKTTFLITGTIQIVAGITIIFNCLLNLKYYSLIKKEKCLKSLSIYYDKFFPDFNDNFGFLLFLLLLFMNFAIFEKNFYDSLTYLCVSFLFLLFCFYLQDHNDLRNSSKIIERVQVLNFRNHILPLAKDRDLKYICRCSYNFNKGSFWGDPELFKYKFTNNKDEIFWIWSHPSFDFDSGFSSIQIEKEASNTELIPNLKPLHSD